jgi:signal transduction histidine kinase
LSEENGDFMQSSGLMNMKKRAGLINAGPNIHSEVDKGTKVSLVYPAG